MGYDGARFPRTDTFATDRTHLGADAKQFPRAETFMTDRTHLGANENTLAPPSNAESDPESTVPRGGGHAFAPP